MRYATAERRRVCEAYGVGRDFLKYLLDASVVSFNRTPQMPR